MGGQRFISWLSEWEVRGSGPGCQSGRAEVQVLVVRVDIGVVTYEVMTHQCGRSVVQVLVVRVDIGVVIYEAMTPAHPVWEVSGSGPACQSGYICGDL